MPNSRKAFFAVNNMKEQLVGIIYLKDDLDNAYDLLHVLDTIHFLPPYTQTTEESLYKAFNPKLEQKKYHSLVENYLKDLVDKHSVKELTPEKFAQYQEKFKENFPAALIAFHKEFLGNYPRHERLRAPTSEAELANKTSLPTPSPAAAIAPSFNSVNVEPEIHKSVSSLNRQFQPVNSAK